MPLVIIIAAYFVLHEDEHLIQKFSALGFGIVGLLLLTLPL
jgi:drug/metabolite transporter (DMT)-like permease